MKNVGGDAYRTFSGEHELGPRPRTQQFENRGKGAVITVRKHSAEAPFNLQWVAHWPGLAGDPRDLADLPDVGERDRVIDGEGSQGAPLAVPRTIQPAKDSRSHGA